MTLQEFRDIIEIVNISGNAGPNIVLHLLQKNGDILTADISDALAAELREVFFEKVKSKYLDNAELRYENISTALETTNTLFFYDIGVYPQDLELLKTFDPWSNDYSDFNFQEDGVEHVKALLITIGNSTIGHFTLYKHIYGIFVTSPKKYIHFFSSNTQFDILKKNVLNITSSIDFIYTRENLIVDNINTLSKNYGYNEIVINQAKSIITSIIAPLALIENIGDLATFIENPKFAKKLMKIKPDSPVLSLDKSIIIEFIKNHAKLKNKFRINDDGKIILNTNASKERMIGILNDAYVNSHLTGLDYEAESKAEMREE